MDTTFFRSREFVVVAVVAGLLVAGGVVAVTASRNFANVEMHEGCTVGAVSGTALSTRPNDTGPRRESGHWHRTVAYDVAAADLGAGALRACTNVGDLDVTTSPDGVARVVFRISGESEQAVAAAVVRARFVDDAGSLVVAADQPQAVEARSLFSSRGVGVDLEVQLPEAGAWGLDVATDVGDVDVEGVVARDVAASTDVGDLTLAGIDLGGNLSVSTDVGDVDVTLESAVSATFDLSTDVGDIDLLLPRSPDAGYDVAVSTDVGSVRVDLGETERYVEEDEDGPSERVEARSAGYASKPTKVRIQATTDVGDVEILVRTA